MPNLLTLPPLTAAFVLSALANGRRPKIVGSSIRRPWSLQVGRPWASQMEFMAALMRFHQARHELGGRLLEADLPIDAVVAQAEVGRAGDAAVD